MKEKSVTQEVKLTGVVVVLQNDECVKFVEKEQMHFGMNMDGSLSVHWTNAGKTGVSIFAPGVWAQVSAIGDAPNADKIEDNDNVVILGGKPH